MNKKITTHIPNYVFATSYVRKSLLLTSLFSFKFTSKFSGIGINTSEREKKKLFVKNTSTFP